VNREKSTTNLQDNANVHKAKTGTIELNDAKSTVNKGKSIIHSPDNANVHKVKIGIINPNDVKSIVSMEKSITILLDSVIVHRVKIGTNKPKDVELIVLLVSFSIPKVTDVSVLKTNIGLEINVRPVTTQELGIQIVKGVNVPMDNGMVISVLI